MRRLEAAMVVGLGNAGQVLHRRAVDVVNTPYPPASSPGQPPHRRSRTLQRGLTVWITRGVGTVVMHMGWRNNDPVYARFLAKGTARMAPRPALPVVLASRRRDILPTVANALKRAL